MADQRKALPTHARVICGSMEDTEAVTGSPPGCHAGSYTTKEWLTLSPQQLLAIYMTSGEEMLRGSLLSPQEM